MSQAASSERTREKEFRLPELTLVGPEALKAWRERERSALRELVDRGVFVRVDRPFSASDLVLEPSPELPFVSPFAVPATGPFTTLGWPSADSESPFESIRKRLPDLRLGTFASLLEASADVRAKLFPPSGFKPLLLPGVGCRDEDGQYFFAVVDYAHPDAPHGQDPGSGPILRGVAALGALRRVPSRVLFRRVSQPEP